MRFLLIDARDTLSLAVTTNFTFVLLFNLFFTPQIRPSPAPKYFLTPKIDHV